MIKSITNFLIILFIFQQLKSQISQIDQNGYNAFCDETLHVFRAICRTRDTTATEKCEINWIGNARIVTARAAVHLSMYID